MAGNRRHAGGMDSAMAKVKRLDGEHLAAALEAASHPVTPLTKREAIERYAKFRDSALGFVPSLERAKRLAEVASPEELPSVPFVTHLHGGVRLAVECQIERDAKKPLGLRKPRALGIEFGVCQFLAHRPRSSSSPAYASSRSRSSPSSCR